MVAAERAYAQAGIAPRDLDLIELHDATAFADIDKTVAWANWTAYLDYDEEKKNYPTLEAFIKETG
ncbi:MAG TPA: hypothetical protein PLP04_19850, partial [Bryobacteraceae bacterium]|nr:hypothetical protein [Bryobacteraceae bacterium]